ncbi:FHA domain-containing protein [Pseudoramibacter porci]|nr:FHA domain-containing protein [Pseudoramibacter porci]
MMSKKMMVPAVLECEGQEISIETSPFNIGSFENLCQLTIEGEEIAPIHCCIVLDQGEWQIIDQKGLGGVDVNGERMDPGAARTLQNGDKIGIGTKTFTFASMTTLFAQGEVEALEEDYRAMMATGDDAQAQALIEKLSQKVAWVKQIAGIDTTDDAARVESEPVVEVEPVSEAEPSVENWEGAVENEAHDDAPASPQIDAPEEQAGSVLANRRVRTVDPDEIHLSQSGQAAPVYGHFISKDPTVPGFEINKTPFTIGRGRTCDHVMKYRGISRQHATVLRDDRQPYLLIRDEGSTNGTYVNGVQLNAQEERPIHPGDVVAFFETAFTVQK